MERESHQSRTVRKRTQRTHISSKFHVLPPCSFTKSTQYHLSTTIIQRPWQVYANKKIRSNVLGKEVTSKPRNTINSDTNERHHKVEINKGVTRLLNIECSSSSSSVTTACNTTSRIFIISSNLSKSTNESPH